MKVIFKNSTLVFASVPTIPAGTELVSSEVLLKHGYYLGNVGTKAVFNSTEGASTGSNWNTRFIPVRAGVKYRFKSAYCIPNASHVLLSTDKTILQKWLISNNHEFVEYTEFTPSENGYICVQSLNEETKISVQNVEKAKMAFDWGTDLP